MAEIANPNLPTFFQDTVLTAARAAEVPAADFAGGMNMGASCAPGIGINTGDYDPKLQDWAESDFNGVNAIPYNGASQNIGTDNGVNNLINAVQGADIDDTLQFVTTVAPVVPGGDLAAGVVNRTGKTVPADANVWGTVTV